MATVDPVGISSSANATNSSCDYRAFPMNHGHARDKIGVTRSLRPTPDRSLLLVDTRYELED